jgi:hypothetical protein
MVDRAAVLLNVVLAGMYADTFLERAWERGWKVGFRRFFIFDRTPFLYLPLLTRVRLNAGFMAVMFFLTARAAVRLTGLGCYEKVGWGELDFFF